MVLMYHQRRDQIHWYLQVLSNFKCYYLELRAGPQRKRYTTANVSPELCNKFEYFVFSYVYIIENEK
jgi:hypothetical protein